MNLRKLFFPPAPAPEPPPKRQIVVVRSTNMTLAQWTEDAGLVKEAQRVLEMPTVQTMIAIARNESPSNYGLPRGASHEDHLAHAYKSEGYAMALNTLESMGVQIEKPIEIESTFEPEKPPFTQ